jgi:hypothetical protein
MVPAASAPATTPRPVRLRFTIAGLMALVLIVGVGFAGLRAASLLWASALFTLAVALLAAAIVGSLVCRGRSRMGWLGFAVFGWTYLLATFWLWPERNGVTAPPFLTKPLLDALRPSSGTGAFMTYDTGPQGEMSMEPLTIVGMGAAGTGNMVTMNPFSGRVFNLHHYRRIGHTLAAILFGFVGALLAAWLSARGLPAEKPHSVDSSPSTSGRV